MIVKKSSPLYNPYKTKLLRLAESKGIKAVNGLYMLVAQAVYAESIWHSIKLDEKIIDELPQLEDDCQLQTTEQKNLSFTDFSEMDFR